MSEIEPAEVSPIVVGETSASEKPAEKARPNRQWLRSSGYVDSNGDIIVSLGTVPNGEDWYIERMSVVCSSTTNTVFGLYAGVVEDAYRVESAIPGNNGIADESSPIWFPGGTEVIGKWSNVSTLDSASNPAIGKVNAQVRVGA